MEPGVNLDLLKFLVSVLPPKGAKFRPKIQAFGQVKGRTSLVARRNILELGIMLD